MRLKVCWLGCLVAFFSVFALTLFEIRAEGNCPQGYYPIGGGNGGWQGCAPIPSSGGGQSSPPDTGPQWAKRWGAIALDPSAGRYGGAEGQSSARRAEKAAVANCKKNGGGRQCKVLGGAYYNQCGALAWGDKRAEAYSAATTDEASTGAVQMCSQKTSNCKIYYSGCSYPVRVR